MTTLKKYLHVFIFSIFLALIVFLQIGPSSRGWPVPLRDSGSKSESFYVLLLVKLIVNVGPGVIVLSLCMIPFGYDTKRTLSVSSLLLLTLAGSISCLIVTPSYLAHYHPVEYLSIFVLTTMAINGLIQWIRHVLEDHVLLPRWRKRDQVDGDFDDLC